MEPINVIPAATLSPQETLLLQDQEIRTQMCRLEHDMRPLRAELEILSARFIQLWRAKNLIEKQLIPVKKITSRKAPLEGAVNPQDLLKQLQSMSLEQQLAIMRTLQKGADES